MTRIGLLWPPSRTYPGSGWRCRSWQTQDTRSTRGHGIVCCLFTAFLLLVAPKCFASSRQKTDVVYLLNGDKITGEIQSLSKGQLSVKPEYASASIIIDWNKVDHLESAQRFVIRDPHGVLYAGSLRGGTSRQTVTIVESANKTLPHKSVIEVSELGQTFLEKLRGNVAVGTSFSRSNAQRDLTVQSGLTYQSQRHIFDFNSYSQFSSQQKTTDTNETTGKTAYLHQLRSSAWYGGAIANFLSSSEQQITLESSIGGVVAKRLISSNRTNLSAFAGLAYTNQVNASGAISNERSQAVDSAMAVRLSTFRFETTNFDTTFWVYPSLTSAGHVRSTLNQDVYYKFKNNLYVSLSFYDNYDNRPVVGAPANNLGATTAVGWSFH